MKKRRYRHGKKFTDPMAAICHVDDGGHIYLQHKFVHSAWASNWSLVQFRRHVNFGLLYAAEEVTDWFERKPDVVAEACEP